MLVLVPTRGRPSNAVALDQAFNSTCEDDTDLLFGIDSDDPRRDEYLDALPASRVTVLERRLRLGPTLNFLAVKHAPDYSVIGFMGDDHRPRTLGWDSRINHELQQLNAGLAYGNDLVHGPNLPTAVFMTSGIVSTLGWMVPPGLTHLFCDDSWITLGRALNAIKYLPDVIIEHCHPLVGKAESDAGYTECNAPEVWEHDQRIFDEWRDNQLAFDVRKIQGAAGG